MGQHDMTIGLSLNELIYALHLCGECENFYICVYTTTAAEESTWAHTARALVKNRLAGNYKIYRISADRIWFENGSQIRFHSAYGTERGGIFHLLLFSSNVDSFTRMIKSTRHLISYDDLIPTFGRGRLERIPPVDKI